MDLQNKCVKNIFDNIAQNIKALEHLIQNDSKTSLLVIGRSEKDDKVGHLTTLQGTSEELSTSLVEQMLEDKDLAMVIEVAYSVYKNTLNNK